MSKSPAHVGLSMTAAVLLVGCAELGLPDWTEVQSTVFPSAAQPDALSGRRAKWDHCKKPTRRMNPAKDSGARLHSHGKGKR